MPRIPDNDLLSAELPLLAWDGGERIAVLVNSSKPDGTFTLIAHGQETSACAAVWEVAAGTCIALIPPLATHLDLIAMASDGAEMTLAIELDADLMPAMVDPSLGGVRQVLFDAEGPALALQDGAVNKGLVSLNFASAGASGTRIKVGPMTDRAADTTVTQVTVTPDGADGGGLYLTFHRPGGPSPVLLAELPANARKLAAANPDLTGASGEELVERGFRLRTIAAGDDASGPHVWTAPEPGDRLLVLAPRGHRLRWGDAAQAGTRLLLTAENGQAITGQLTSHAYRPATSTALAALGGGSANAVTLGNAADVSADVIDTAATISEAWWKRARVSGPAPTPWLAAGAGTLTVSANHPMARLTLAAAQSLDAGVSPLTAATGAALGLPPAIVEEIEALPSFERATFARWAALAPEVTARAARARVVPTGAPSTFAVTALGRQLVLATQENFASEMASLAERLAAKALTPDQKADVRRVQEWASAEPQLWRSAATLEPVLDLHNRNPSPLPKVAPAAQFIARLRQDRQAWSAAQREGGVADLGEIAERRALIPGLMARAGVPAEVASDLEANLAALSSTEILLLHGYLVAAERRQALVQSVRRAVLGLDEAAGSRGLATRLDRSGDPLVGMTRIGSASEAVVSTLVKLPQVRESLVALMGWIDGKVAAPDAGHALSEQLVRNLKSYGCFLLMNAVSSECRALQGEVSDSAAAFGQRLRSGLAETLPRLVATAVARAGGEELHLGLDFTRRLPTLQDGPAR